ncbi:MAG TPA: hypothetical protein VHB18_06255 [Mycobacteriales bacterium]|jgi:predicted lipoprotein with Yx(FWY)xxD motif|nr:hypothetical protein [Mycobacteriales bacterium]
MSLSSLATRKLALGTGIAAASLGLAATASAVPSKAAHQKISTVKISLGRVLSNPSGRVMYLFEIDGKNVSHCNATCRLYWPPVMSKGKPVAGPHVRAKHLGRTAAGQVTYYGHPLYYYSGDTKPRQHRGEELDLSGGEWYVVATNGHKIEKGDDND